MRSPQLRFEREPLLWAMHVCMTVSGALRSATTAQVYHSVHCRHYGSADTAPSRERHKQHCRESPGPPAASFDLPGKAKSACAPAQGAKAMPPMTPLVQ